MKNNDEQAADSRRNSFTSAAKNPIPKDAQTRSVSVGKPMNSAAGVTTNDYNKQRMDYQIMKQKKRTFKPQDEA